MSFRRSWPNFSPKENQAVATHHSREVVALSGCPCVPFPDHSPHEMLCALCLGGIHRVSRDIMNAYQELSHYSLAGPETILLDPYYSTFNPTIPGLPQQYLSL